MLGGELTKSGAVLQFIRYFLLRSEDPLADQSSGPPAYLLSNGIFAFDSRSNYVFHTKATIQPTKGIVELGVKTNGSSVHNLLPRPIAS
jgi:hypothetical protein